MTTAAPADPALDALLVEARDPTTPPERLRFLVQLGVGDGVRHPIKESVAANPNTPVEVLINLASYFPEAFCRNPVAPLVLLEQPDFLRRMPQKRSLLRCSNVPLALVTMLATHETPDIAREARMHVAIAGEVPSEEWIDAIHAHWREHIERASKAERESYADFAALGLAPDWVTGSDGNLAAGLRSRILRASDPATPAEELLRLWGNVHEEADRAPKFWRKAEAHLILHIALSLNPSLPFRAHPAIRTFVRTALRPVAVEMAIAKHLPAGDPCEPGTYVDATQIAILAICCTTIWSLGRNAGRPLTPFLWPMQPERFSEDHQRCARSYNWRERLGAACALKPKYRKSAEALKSLADDGNRLVRAAARARLADPAQEFHW